jgi:hypothetical protein
MIDVSTFLFLVTIFSIVTSLFTEALKKAIGEKIAANILVAIVSLVVGIGGGAIAYTLLDISFAINKNIVVLILFFPIDWLCAMLGYDKVMQTIAQILGNKK